MQRPRRLQPFVRPSSSSNSNCFPLLFLILIRSFGSSAILLPVSFSTMYPNALAPDQTSRFRSFDLHVRIRHELEKFIFLMAEGSPAPLLESLELRVQRCSAYDTIVHFESFLTAFRPAPRLAHIEIPGWPLPEPLSQLPNMTSFTIDSMSLESIDIQEIILFLGSIPSIQHFVYKGHGTS